MAKTKLIIYWVITIWLSFGISFGAITQLTQNDQALKGIQHLGYPTYFLYILGIWKLLAVIALLVPRFTLLKEWAYAGLFFAMSGALASHLFMNDPFSEIFPSLLTLILVIASWFLRPQNRKIQSL